MADLPCMMVVRARYLDIMNGLEKLVDDFNLLNGLGSLIKLYSDRSCIARLIKLDVFGEP